MSFEQLIGLCLIILMMGIVLLATRFVSSAVYNDKGLWHITIRAIFWDDQKYKFWLKNNLVYWWCVLLIVCLCVVIMALIPPFRQGHVYVRPIISLLVSIPLWTSIFYTYKWFFKRVGKN